MRAIYLGQGCWDRLDDISEEQALDLLEKWKLHSDSIRLTSEKMNITFQSQKHKIHVGCHEKCDLMLGERSAPIHATFSREDNLWFLRDNYSENGTWINGTRIRPGENYLLRADDVIDFAHKEVFVFNKTEGVYIGQFDAWLEWDRQIGFRRDDTYSIVRFLGMSRYHAAVYLVREENTNA